MIVIAGQGEKERMKNKKKKSSIEYNAAVIRY
jgi:hypothetical protein